MRFSVGQKIFSIAAVTLALMLAVALYSIKLIDNIADDLDSISGKQIPVSEAISRIDVHIMHHSVFLERVLLLAEEELGSPETLEARRNSYAVLGQAVEKELTDARVLLKAEPDESSGRHALSTIEVMTAGLAEVEIEFQTLRDRGDMLLDAVDKNDHEAFVALLDEFNRSLERTGKAIDTLRFNANGLVNRAVADADRDEHLLLITNSLLTVFAALLGFSFSVAVTRALVGAVRNLVAGTEAVEAGDFDVEIDVVSRDEVGQLTGSFNSMVAGLRLRERIKDTFGKYMDPRIVAHLLEHSEFTESDAERREMTVMFVDLKSFVTISERFTAGDLVRFINRFFAHMTEAISGKAGVVDKFMGDAVMAYWGPPFTSPDEHARLACDAARAAIDHLETFRTEIAAEIGGEANGLDIDVRIGIATGKMVVGTVGSLASRSFTVMGDTVNLGSRLEITNKAYGTRVMISERTMELAGDVGVRDWT
jgi:class 3 adenylate cyclase